MSHHSVPTQIKVVLISLAMGGLAACIFAFMAAKHAKGHDGYHNHDHHRFHAYYQNWINKEGRGCCNDRDCRTISESDVMEFDGVISVRIEGELCPVLARHYLARGKSPNWDSAHVCVQPKGVSVLPQGPCERLLCFVPKPLS